MIGNVIYLSGYFKLSASLPTNAHLITFSGLTGQFQLQYIFIHNYANGVSARLETSTNNGHPSIKMSTALNDTSNYQYISAVFVT